MPKFRLPLFSLLRPLGLLAAFLGGFWGLSALIDPLVPFAPVPSVSEKLAYFRAHANEFDTLFIGSSRIYRQIDPSIFDQTIREAGGESSSFNFGIDGMFSPEDLYICEQILALKPAKLRRVFLESSGFYINFANKNPESLRATYWHDRARLSLLYRQIFQNSERRFRWRNWKLWLEEKSKGGALFVQHLEAFFKQSIHFGQGATLLGEQFQTTKPPDLVPILGSANNGYSPSDIEGTPAGLAAFDLELADRQKKPARIASLHPAAQSELERLFAAIRAAGAEPVMIISPTTGNRRIYPPKGSGVQFLDFSEIQAWPKLYAREHRLDPAHLNRAGSAIYSRALAELFLTSAKKEQP